MTWVMSLFTLFLVRVIGLSSYFYFFTKNTEFMAQNKTALFGYFKEICSIYDEQDFNLMQT